MPTSPVPPSSKLRIAFIGAGAMANRVHYPSLASFEDVALEALCDLDPGRLNATGDRWGISRRYTDYRRMVEEVAPDAVYAIGPPHHFYDIWTWCLRQGLHLFVEKPLGTTLHQARSLAHLAEQHGCITQVGFQRRTCPLLVQLRDECLRRGPIVHSLCEFYKCEPTPYLEARDRLMDDGIHALDTLRWMCGGELLEVRSLTRRVGVPDINFVAALAEFDSGATGLLANSWSSGRRIFRVEMHAPGICAEGDPEGMGSTPMATPLGGSGTRGKWRAATSSTSSRGSRPRAASSSTACGPGASPAPTSPMPPRPWSWRSASWRKTC